MVSTNHEVKGEKDGEEKNIGLQEIFRKYLQLSVKYGLIKSSNLYRRKGNIPVLAGGIASSLPLTTISLIETRFADSCTRVHIIGELIAPSTQ